MARGTRLAEGALPSADDTIRYAGPSVTRCGPYELIREIGRGGMGTVWEARHVTLGRRVAVKILHAEFAKNPELLARFLREGRAAARIEHPHVAAVYDVGQDDARAWLVMELLEGEDLGTRLDREGRLDATRAVDILLPVLAAVSAAHDEGVVHRDLKPGNIFLARDRAGVVSPRLVDFGFSKIRAADAEEDLDLTRPDTALGTLSYMSVEQVRASREATPACDQYALGVTLYRCVTGRLPFEGRTSADTFMAILKGQCARPGALVPSLPEGLDAVILRAMHRDAPARFASVRAFGAALLPHASPATRARWAETFDAPTPVAPAREPEVVWELRRPARPPPPRTRALLALAVAVLAGALAALMAAR